MDQGAAAGTGGTFISLSETEQRCYSGLHALCQPDGTGTPAAGKVAELFRASQLPADTLHQITEVCGAKRLGYFGCGQFYVALKLMAAAQAGLPVRLESVAGELPLPVFVGITRDPEMRYPTHPPTNESQPHIAGSAPRPPADRPVFRHPESSMDEQEAWSPPRSPPRSPSAYHSYPYSAQRNGTDALLAYDGKLSSRSSVSQENSSPSHYFVRLQPEPLPITQVSSVDYSDDPWRITEEQREYYTNQFKSLQPDLNALILGTTAKNFFTKSKLPIPELSHIWELSDVDKDGALTFSEFCIAFHLIVARKNSYVLPETLPPTLRPGYVDQGVTQSEELSSVDRQVTSRPGVNTCKQDTRDERRQSEFSPKRLPDASEKPIRRVSTLKPDSPQELDASMKSRTRPRSHSSTSIDDAMKKAEEPPTPPPRPQKTHSRASSLDLNKLFQQSGQASKSSWLPPPPALPPRPPATQIFSFRHGSNKNTQKAVQQPNFADFSRFREVQETSTPPQRPDLRGGLSTEDLAPPKTDPSAALQGHAPQKPVRRKLHPDSQSATPPSGTPSSAATLTKSTQRLPPKQKRAIQMAIRKNRETNAVLTRLNSELQQQLKVVHRERVTLESQLDLLRPVTSA
ncbi:ralBP1-associated Eps domain-containing protein 2 isoform X1 [Triplophysa rosa]|uniref:RalBP1-associated Eps domain-containing protein 2-like n=1 Tax=Triplophysa rosa TaxID=992332 RepID=A0A9W7TDL5_TRIRA|nr:ralBP1-associated Eps domain-containing protein 2 isoform X1 [Triplophysa rosa]KAI7794528.1 putative ralBP1-associated Eps domain-containing protein 2-like [Triplophysa rosa]